MKAILLLSVLITTITLYKILSTPPAPHDDLYQIYTSWKSKFEMTFEGEEDIYRFSIFSNNYKIIQEHNAGEHSWWMSLNQFTALTPEEFNARFNLGNPRLAEDATDPHCPSANNCPTLELLNATSVNWTQAGAVTPVQFEGNCASGWAFSATGALEGLHFMNTSNLTQFSVQQIIDCCPNTYACEGGFPYLAISYTATDGIETWADYPYVGQQENCHYRVNRSRHVNTGYQCVQQSNFSQMVAAVNQMPVSIAVEANQPVWQYYGGGVIPGLCGAELDLGVLLVGYENIGGQNAWIIKNNWGTTWGDNGYAYVSQDATANGGYGVCGVLRCGTLAVNNPSSN